MRRGGAEAGGPGQDVVVVLLQKGFEPGELRLGEIIDMGVDEPADDEVGLLDSTVMGAESRTLPPRRQRIGRRLVQIRTHRPDDIIVSFPAVSTLVGWGKLPPMRPEVLFPLFAPVTSLPGIGPRLKKPVETLAGPHVVDLCWHLPSGLIDRRFAPKIADAPDGVVATVTVTVDDHRPPPRGRERVPYRVLCSDETGFMTLVFFHAKGDYLLNALPIGEKRVVSGRVEHYDGQTQMTHPDHIVPLEKRAEIQTVEPVYPLTAGADAAGAGAGDPGGARPRAGARRMARSRVHET